MILIAMIFMHIVDDYYLQGWLANGKQKQWWKENAPDKLYKYDYIVALLMHSFSWSVMIFLPILYVLNFEVTVEHIIPLITNIIIHAVVDDLKANKKWINLIVDQAIHLLQIFLLYDLYCDLWRVI